MSIQEVSAEQLAKPFHHYQEARAHDFNRPNSENEAHSWDQTPQNERSLMVAAARLALLELAATAEQTNLNRRYFAKPGEADWGC
jgi:hypothetical protein